MESSEEHKMIVGTVLLLTCPKIMIFISQSSRTIPTILLKAIIFAQFIFLKIKFVVQLLLTDIYMVLNK